MGFLEDIINIGELDLLSQRSTMSEGLYLLLLMVFFLLGLCNGIMKMDDFNILDNDNVKIKTDLCVIAVTMLAVGVLMLVPLKTIWHMLSPLEY